LLAVADLQVSYGGITAVKGISFAVEEGELVCLIGANGAGKTSTLKALARMLPGRGEIHYDGRRIDAVAAHELIGRGLALVPEGRGVFARLSVAENLAMGAYHRRDAQIAADLDHIYDLLPRLKERVRQLAGTLSGGEQQMLAIGRALMTNPRLLILDEATEGLAPLIVAEIWRVIGAIRATGIATLVVDRNYRAVLTHTDRAVVLEKGQLVMSGESDALDFAELGQRLGV